MTRSLRYRWTRAALALVLALQGIAASALAGGTGVDVGSFVCAPNGPVSAETEQAARDLLGFLSDDEKPAHAEHCPLCVLDGANGFLLQAASAGMRIAAARAVSPAPVDRHAVGATGPPLGGRAPPVFH
ncbi:MAG: DUF2946 family protein [Pseudomonadota bacterium]